MSDEHENLYVDLLSNPVAVQALLDGPWGDTIIDSTMVAKHCPICQAFVPWNITDPIYSPDAALAAHKGYHIAVARLLARAIGPNERF